MQLVRMAVMVLATTLTGCVATHYTKTVEVTKDARGRILQTRIVETAQQDGQGWPIKFGHLKGVITNEDARERPSSSVSGFRR